MIAFGVIMMAAGVVILTIPWIQGLGLFAIVWGLILLVLGFYAKVPGEKPATEQQQLVVAKPSESAPQAPPVSQPVTKEVYRETIIREIVKIRCRNCGTLFEEKVNRCPHCGAPP
jgi:hypothetical protein